MMTMVMIVAAIMAAGIEIAIGIETETAIMTAGVIVTMTGIATGIASETATAMMTTMIKKRPGSVAHGNHELFCSRAWPVIGTKLTGKRACWTMPCSARVKR